MLRFAPTPDGEMHIGNLRVALFNYIVAKQRDEALVIRIEDIDSDKTIEGKDQEIVGILELFGIEYSQVVHQSQNFKFHSAMALQLLHEKKAFSCFCSDEWLEKKRQEAKEAQKPYRYDDACRNLPAELVIDNTAPFTVRVVSADKTIVIQDYIQGKISFAADTLDSFVILNRDKTPTYDFACAIDDMLSDISIVIRDEHYINNTPKQIHIREQLGYDKKVEYAHLSRLVNGADVSVKQLLEDGFLPEAIANYLILLSSKTPCEIFTIKEAVKWFELDTVSNSSICFDMQKLKDINVKHLKIMDAKELSRYVGFADADIGELARLYLGEAVTTKDLKAKIAPIFEERKIPETLQKEVNIITKLIKAAPYFDTYSDFKAYIVNESNLKEEELVKVLSIVLTNAEDGPDIAEVYKYLKNYIGEIVK